jgi:ADP-ribosylation factor related protein 1
MPSRLLCGKQPCSHTHDHTSHLHTPVYHTPFWFNTAKFTLLYGLIEYIFRKDEYHVLILGVDKAGKTNVLERLKTVFTPVVGLDPGKILPTVGLNVGRLDAAGQSFVFWDLGGQSGLRSIWDKYYEESHAVVFVVDAASRNRFQESKAALEGVLDHRQLVGAPLLVMANKQDLENAACAQEVSDVYGLGRVNNRLVKVIPVCAYTGQGLKEGVEWLSEQIKKSGKSCELPLSFPRVPIPTPPSPQVATAPNCGGDCRVQFVCSVF